MSRERSRRMDFISPQRRALAQKLLDGLTPAAILEEDRRRGASEAGRQSCSRSDSGAGEQELRMVADYLRVLRKEDGTENEIKSA